MIFGLQWIIPIHCIQTIIKNKKCLLIAVIERLSQILINYFFLLIKFTDKNINPSPINEKITPTQPVDTQELP